VGDFNAVLGAHEKRGTRLPPKISCEDFHLWTNANQLSHLNTICVHFTWTNGCAGNGYVALCLDHAICNHAWLSHWRAVHCYTLHKHCSDHHPLIVSQELVESHHVWTSNSDCTRYVKEIWAKRVYGNPMVCLQTKLKRLKVACRAWNKTVFGNIDTNVKIATDEVIRIQT
jgi:hypothetical protein